MPTQFVTSIVYEQSDGFLAGKKLAEQAMQQMRPATYPDLIVLFGSTNYDYSAVMRGIRQIVKEKVPIIGSSGAGLFTEREVHKTGLSCAFIQSDSYKFYSGISPSLKSDTLKAIENIVQTFPKEIEGYPYYSAMLFVDGLAGKGEDAVLAAASLLGSTVKFAGGAAADDLNYRETYVFGQDQSLSDAVSICLVASKQPVIISVKHGHHPISPPLKVTRAEGNVIYEVEGQPPFQVWKHYLADRLKAKKIDVEHLTPQELSKFLVEYEAGLLIGENEYKIRFPMSCNEDGSFNFVCPIIEGSVIKIMDSDEQNQIDSARQAAQTAIKAAHGIKLAGAIIFDCACRAMILQEEFAKAVETNKEAFGSLPFIGYETYGEIAMEIGQLSGFHNATTVIMLFPD